jgi:hypothetical protein
MRGRQATSIAFVMIVLTSALLAGAPAGAPAARAEALAPPALCCMGFAYMPEIDKVVMYGGLDSSGVVSDATWFWDPADGWTQAIEHSPPGPRTSTRMIYDPAQGKIVLFGGKAAQKGYAVDNVTWLFDGSTWTSCTSCSTRPPARMSEALEYYPGRMAATVMFGGFGGGTFLNDTWMLKGSPPNWVPCPAAQCPAASLPSRRSSPSMAFDGQSGRLVMFGGQNDMGQLGDTWFFTSGSKPAWHQCTDAQCPPGSPSFREGQRMVSDPLGREIVLFGAGRPVLLGDTWLWSGKPGGWVQCAASNGCPATPTPAARCCVGLTYDSTAEKVVLYGGAYQTAPMAYADTWTWDAVDGWQCQSATCSS